MDNCKIIQDLLPSFCDGLTSQETNALIGSHTACCPDCANLLKKMSAEPPREVMDHREQFRRALQEYQQKHRMKVLRLLLCCALAVFLVILIWANSFNLALLFAGINRNSMTVVENSAVRNTGWTTQFILHSADGEYALTTITKNDILNFWYVDTTEKTDGVKKPYITAMWFGESSHRWFEGMELTTDFESNYIYVGNNAVAPIDLASEDIPGDVLIKVNQQGNRYWIHVVSDDMDALNHLDLFALLMEKGYIK